MSISDAEALASLRIRVPSSERLRFRRWREDDLPLARLLWDDRDVTARIGAVDAAARLELERTHDREHGVQYWPMFERASDADTESAFVGCAGLKPRDPERHVFELGFHLRPAHWGKGFATEAARAVVRFAFAEAGARELFAGHHPENAASRGVLLKIGFRYTGDELFPPTGLMHPSYSLVP